MLVYLLRRIALALSVVLATVTLTFVIFFAGPSNAAEASCPRNCTNEQIATIEKGLGLDKPRIEQYGTYMKGLVAGRDIPGGFAQHCDAPCLGWSFNESRSVTTMVSEALPVTASIIVGGAIVYIVVGLLLGIISARARGTLLDRVVVGVTQFVPAVPYYVLALLFFLYLVKINPILPEAKYTSPLDNPWTWITGMMSVWIIYGLIQSTNYVRYVRSFMIDTLSQDYVRTARSKGLSERKVVLSHALRAAIAPFVTLVGLSLGAEFAGAIFTERIFGLHGMGDLGITAFSNSDLPVLAGVAIVSAAFVTVINLIVDLVYVLIDPRVKLN